LHAYLAGVVPDREQERNWIAAGVMSSAVMANIRLGHWWRQCSWPSLDPAKPRWRWNSRAPWMIGAGLPPRPCSGWFATGRG
jgi:hypothetical protein